MKENKGQANNIQYAIIGLLVISVIISGVSLAMVSGISVPSNVATTDDLTTLSDDVDSLDGKVDQLSNTLDSVQQTQEDILAQLGGQVARITVTSVNVTPTEVEMNQEATVSVTVTNSGNAEGTEDIPLMVDGEQETSQSVTLAPGESQTVTFTVTRSTEGQYTISSLGVTATLTVAGGIPPGLPSDITIAWTTGPEADFIESNLPEFEEDTGIDVHLRTIPRAQLVEQVMIELLSEDPTIDGAVIHIPQLPTLAATGELVNLYQYMSRQEMLDSGMFEEQLDALEYRDNLYMLQGQWNGALLTYYREDYFNDPDYQSAYESEYGQELRPPQNPEEMLQVAKFWDAQQGAPDDGKGPDGLYPIHLQLTTQEVGAGAYMFFPPLAQYFGGGIYNSETDEILADSEGTIEAMRYLKELSTHAQDTVLVDGTFEAQQAVNQATCIMADQWSYMIPMLDNAEINEAAGKWGLSQRFCPQFPDMLGIVALDTPQKNGVWELIKWINFSDTISKGLLQTTPKAPNREQTLEEDWLKETEWIDPIMDSYGREMPLARLIDHPRSSRIYEDMMRRVHQALTGDRTPEAAMEALADDIAEIVGQ